jgi:hypothetical protein
MAKNKILFLTGSPNQTTQMHQISKFLDDQFDCYFSQIFSSHAAFKMVVKTGILDRTIFSGEIKLKADKYLQENNLKNDYQCKVYQNKYNLVVACTDIILPKSLSGIKTIWVQEGMIDGYNFLAKIIKALKLPRYFALSTALNGSSNLCDIYCAGSTGYKNYLAAKGTDREKIAATGIPNYDNLKEYLDNDFPHKDYVLVATSDIRETFRYDNRTKFIKQAVQIANGRRLIFKLHPNEKKKRAISEIKRLTPANTLIYTEGNTNHMIANCCELITQYSTVVFVGLVLGKKVYSYFDVEELKRLTPIQNNGSSAEIIAGICRNFISYTGSGAKFLKEYNKALSLPDKVIQ